MSEGWFVGGEEGRMCVENRGREETEEMTGYVEVADSSGDGDGVREVEKTSVNVVRVGEGEDGEVETEVIGERRGEAGCNRACIDRDRVLKGVLPGSLGLESRISRGMFHNGKCCEYTDESANPRPVRFPRAKATFWRLFYDLALRSLIQLDFSWYNKTLTGRSPVYYYLRYIAGEKYTFTTRSIALL